MVAGNLCGEQKVSGGWRREECGDVAALTGATTAMALRTSVVGTGAFYTGARGDRQLRPLSQSALWRLSR
jgi:hypothetical protein